MVKQIRYKQSTVSPTNLDESVQDSTVKSPYVYTQFWLKLSGVLPLKSVQDGQKGIKIMSTIYSLYCRLISSMLWILSIRAFILMFIDDPKLAFKLGDLTVLFTDNRYIYYRMVYFCWSASATLIATSYALDETQSCLVPFNTFNSSRLNHYYNTTTYRKLKYLLTICFCWVIIVTITGVLSHLHYQSMIIYNLLSSPSWNPIDLANLNVNPSFWLILHAIWYFYITSIVVFTAFHFSLICSVLEQQFDLVTSKTELILYSDNIKLDLKDSSLLSQYVEHNYLCETLIKSNSFWKSVISTISGFYIVNLCYIFYTLSYGQVNLNLFTFYCLIAGFNFLILYLIFFPAAAVAKKAFAVNTALYLSGSEFLPSFIYVESFILRLKCTIGYSAYRFFVIKYTTIGAVISATITYFLIVADFSRSTGSSTPTNDTDIDVSLSYNRTLFTNPFFINISSESG
uniref:Gustatory receptor n=1 Tax=Tetranychus urticae TaxID=32264 RepID=T1KG20_TETUR